MTASTMLPLIARAKLFGNPTRSRAQISPDGRWLSWIAPKDGVLNVWLAPAEDLGAARVITEDKKRPRTISADRCESTLDLGGIPRLYGVKLQPQCAGRDFRLV